MNKRQNIQLKVCGLRDPENILAVAALPVDGLGFIFHPASPRFVGEDFVPPKGLGAKELVGVFVDEKPEILLEKARLAGLTTLQMHGAESPETCRQLRELGFKVWKAVAVKDAEDLPLAKAYEGCVDAILLDTKSSLPGGNGHTFDWNLLQHYDSDLPFFLAGGISLAELPRLQAFQHPRWRGIDLNSRFESAPGRKDIALLRQFISQFTIQEFQS